jgi:hypothetical protein
VDREVKPLKNCDAKVPAKIVKADLGIGGGELRILRRSAFTECFADESLAVEKAFAGGRDGCVSLSIQVSSMVLTLT